MDKAKKRVSAQNYSKEVVVRGRPTRRFVTMKIRHLPLSKEAFISELKDEIEKFRFPAIDYVSVDVYEKREWAFCLSVTTWDCNINEDYRIEYSVPFLGDSLRTRYLNFDEDLDGVIEIFYKTLCEEEDPLMIGEWEDSFYEDEEEEKFEKLHDLEKKYKAKFGKKLNGYIYKSNMDERMELIERCLDKGKTYEESGLEKEVEEMNKERKKWRAEYRRERAKSRAKVKAILES